jgi:phospholipase/carboxylesterase
MSNGVSTRRTFVKVLGSTVVGLAGCGGPTGVVVGNARITARPGTPATVTTPGTRALGLGVGTTDRDGLLLVPASYDPNTPTPLMLSLHGAGSTAEQSIDAFGPYAEAEGFVLLAPESRASTWDAITGAYGQDVRFVDDALALTFVLCNIDPTRVIIEGFSDGASYGLGLGLANGDLFTHLMAFSPGFIPAFEGDPVGTPRVFVSHGTNDPVLPIDASSRAIVEQLEGQGYDVLFVEHESGHAIPASAANQAIAWALGD